MLIYPVRLDIDIHGSVSQHTFQHSHHDKLCCFKWFPAENKSGVAVLLLVKLLDKRYKDGGDSVLHFLEVRCLCCISLSNTCAHVHAQGLRFLPMHLALHSQLQQFWSGYCHISIRMSLPVSHAEHHVTH